MLHMLQTYALGQQAVSGRNSHDPITNYAMFSISTAIWVFLGYAVWKRNGLALCLTIGIYSFFLYWMFSLASLARAAGAEKVIYILALYVGITLVTLMLAFPDRLKKQPALSAKQDF
jgi:hypothetical protein